MGLLKDIDTPQGVLTNYHSIDRMSWDSKTNELVIILASYVDEAKFNSGALPVCEIQVSVPMDRFTSDPRAWLYPLIPLVPGILSESIESDPSDPVPFGLATDQLP